MKYDLSRIMHKAWNNYHRCSISLSEALCRAWASAKAEPINSERIAAVKASQGVTEKVHTWADWRALGYEVIHGSKALFSVDLIWGSRGKDAVYRASFFGASQVQPITENMSA